MKDLLTENDNSVHLSSTHQNESQDEISYIINEGPPYFLSAMEFSLPVSEAVMDGSPHFTVDAQEVSLCSQ